MDFNTSDACCRVFYLSGERKIAYRSSIVLMPISTSMITEKEPKWLQRPP